MIQKALGISVIGLGRWGPNHVRNFGAIKGCRLASVADTSATRRDSISCAFPQVPAFENAAEAISRDDVDAVVVSTPTATHYEIVRGALEAGKHVLCEKPLTACSGQAWELVQLAERIDRHLMVGHVFLFNPGIEYLSRSIRDQVAGRLYYVNAVRTNLGPFRYDVNAAWDLASHDIYILNHILGERPASVTASGGSYLNHPIEDIVFVTLEYPSGTLGHIHVSWLDPRKVRQITVVGEKKMITWDDLGLPGPVMIFDREVTRDPQYETFGEFQLLAREGDVVLPRVPAVEPLAAQARAFAARCRGSDDDRRGSARDGAEVVDILEAATRSLANHARHTEVRYGG